MVLVTIIIIIVISLLVATAFQRTLPSITSKQLKRLGRNLERRYVYYIVWNKALTTFYPTGTQAADRS